MIIFWPISLVCNQLPKSMLRSGKISREKLSKNSNYPPFATVFFWKCCRGEGGSSLPQKVVPTWIVTLPLFDVIFQVLVFFFGWILFYFLCFNVHILRYFSIPRNFYHRAIFMFRFQHLSNFFSKGSKSKFHPSIPTCLDTLIELNTGNYELICPLKPIRLWRHCK